MVSLSCLHRLLLLWKCWESFKVGFQLSPQLLHSLVGNNVHSQNLHLPSSTQIIIFSPKSLPWDPDYIITIIIFNQQEA